MVDWKVIELVSDDDGYAIRAEDAEVTQVLVDYRLGFIIADGGTETLRVTISTPFEFTPAGEMESVRIDPEGAEAALGRLVLEARHQRLTSCLVDKSGRLRMRLGEMSIDVAPDSEYEAWDVDHPQFKLVAMPGGEVAEWNY